MSSVTRAAVDRRTGLLDAADRVVRRQGPAAAMSVIATEAGITKPILYRHFGDKSGLFRALATRHIDELMDRLRTALLTPGGIPDRARATVDSYLAAIESDPQVYRFLVHRAAMEDTDVHSQVQGFVQRFGDELAIGLSNEPTLGAINEVRAKVWAHAAAGMVQAAGDWWLDAQHVPRAQVVDELLSMLLGGLRSH